MFKTREYIGSLRQMLGRTEVDSDMKAIRKKKPSSTEVSETKVSKEQEDNDYLPLKDIALDMSKRGERSERYYLEQQLDFTVDDEKVPLRKIARKFYEEFSKGVILEAASSKGTLKEILISITFTHFKLGNIGESSTERDVSLLDIGQVQSGLTRHLVTIFPDEINDRAFHLVLKSRSVAATFVAPTERRKDQILNGIHAILELL